ncbi:PAS domain-containing protein [Halobacterium wangiae]|uniref:PAS domain-containing protein n=1 Tax=Halobacterium wangiae TaxID=2902623 RepID=UPI001E46A9C7|nr:PAS domain-containing protein [Halobacterium wangiae]
MRDPGGTTEEDFLGNRDVVEGIVQTSPVGITVVDGDGTLAFANERAEEIYGRSREEINEFTHDDSRWGLVGEHGQPLEAGEAPFDRIVAEETEIHDQIIGLHRPSGERVWVSVNGAPQWNEDGELERAIFTFKEVTERRKREREVEESERRYRTLVDNFPNGAVALVDEDLTYQTVGGEPLEEAGAPAEDIEGKQVSEAVPRELADELVPRYEAAFDGESSTFQVESNDRIYRIRIVPVFDDDGHVFVALGVSQDVTEQRNRERELKESERRYRTLVDNFPGGSVGLFNENLTYDIVGGELLEDLGIDSADVVGTNIYARYPDDLVTDIEPNFHAVFEGESSTFEVDLPDRDLLAHTLPVRNAAGEIYAGMVVVQDITDQKEYQRRLEESNERLEQFAYAASHDLQEPLRMISSYLQLLEDRYTEDLEGDGQEFVEFAVDGAERMRDMIQGLLAYSRVETQGNPFEPVDLDTIVADICEDLGVKIEERDADITIEDLPTVAGDASQLRQVFQNLLDNAIEYSGDAPPRIHVAAERDGDEWAISISDEGIGIDTKNQERVFEVFQRLHSRDEHPGTGLGLALCERIIERHGGDIWVESEPGEGTTFSFTLPDAGGDEQGQD